MSSDDRSRTAVGSGVGRRWVLAGLVCCLLLALVLPLGPLAYNRFHHDEALYGFWATRVLDGDFLLSGQPVDKPPLFLYALAFSMNLLGTTETAARIPSLLAHTASVWLVFALGRSLYDDTTGLLAAALLALSPFAILFAPTAFTDPMMVAFVLGSCLLASRGRPAWSGFLMGLAFGVKQQGIFFAPLAAGIGVVGGGIGLKDGLKEGARFAGGLVLAFAPALIWDAARDHHPGFLYQSLLSYGGLQVAPADWGERAAGFLDLLRCGLASRVMNAMFVVGLPVLVAWGLAVRTEGSAADAVIAGFALIFLGAHVFFSFRVWDRYLLGLIPLEALLMARILHLPVRLLRGRVGAAPCAAAVVLLLALTMARPAGDAFASRYGVGGDHGAYRGIDSVAAYFRGHVQGDATLYHRWLGRHLAFYLRGYPYDFRAYTSPAGLARMASVDRGAQRYVVFPSWRSATETRIALEEQGIRMRPVHVAYRDDGSVSFTVYSLEELE